MGDFFEQLKNGPPPFDAERFRQVVIDDNIAPQLTRVDSNRLLFENVYQIALFLRVPLETLATRLARDLKTKVAPYHDLDGKYEWEEHRHKLVLTGEFSRQQVKDAIVRTM